MARQRSDSMELREGDAPHRGAAAPRSLRPARHGRLGVRGAWFLLMFAAHAIAPVCARTTSAPAILMGGQLTWEINPGFSRGMRNVTFTLLTAFEMDRHCAYRGRMLNTSLGAGCTSDHGFLCVDQFQVAAFTTDTTSGAFGHQRLRTRCDRTAGLYGGRENNFEIVRTQHINGLNIVFGKLKHTVVADPGTIAMMAYFQHGEVDILPQCQINITDTPLPCALNVVDLDRPGAPQYALRTLPGFEIELGKFDYDKYWSAEQQHLNGLKFDQIETLVPLPVQKAPMFEVYVRLCPTTGSHACSSPQSTHHIKNYYSPVPSLPPFIEVAVTSYTQRADWDRQLARKQGWLYNGSSFVDYFTPHPPLRMTAYDLDGHQMAQVSADWGVTDTKQDRYNSNLGLECFSGADNGKTWPFQDLDGELDEAYQHPEMRKAGTCNIYFDMDRSGGSSLKFDFNFGSNRTMGRYYRPDGNYTQSVLFGNDLNRCRGSSTSGMLACDPASGAPCRDRSTGHESICSGNLMFTHHMMNTVDLPWMDVDNTIGTRGRYTVKEPRFFTTGVEPGSSLVKSLVSAYMCWAGTANQPPRFMRNLEVVPNVTDYLRVPGVKAADYLQPEDTEITCTAGQPCIFPIYAQDFLLNTEGKSCVTGPFTPVKGPSEPCVFRPEEDESARYQSTDVVRIEMAPGWEIYDPVDDIEGEETEGADLVRAYCSGGDLEEEKSDEFVHMGCVRDSDCPPGFGTCTGYKANDDLFRTQVRPGYCIAPTGKGLQDEPVQYLETPCRTDYDCRKFNSKCAVPSCESSSFLSSKSYGAKTSSGGLGSLKCFYKEYFKPKQVGTIQTRCFVATDPQGDKYFNNETFFAANPDVPRPWDGKCNQIGLEWRPGFQAGPNDPTDGGIGYVTNPLFRQGTSALPWSVHGCESDPPIHKQGDYARTCKSMPVCFKIKVEGKAPQFVEPTPLEANSYDDNGLLVERRTDVPACEGYEMRLTIKAQDEDGDNVRIFVEDKDEDIAVASQLDKNLRGERYLLEETYNLDFFNTSTMRFRAAALGNSQGKNFEPYAATREGDNFMQDTILAFNPTGAKSIGTAYAPWVNYSHNATQRIRYKLDVGRKNGLIVRLADDEGALDDPQNCMVGDVNSTVNDNRCRERLLNMDQTICAFAYDDSRYTSGRWVGKTDPNGKGKQQCMETGRPLGTPKESSAKMYVPGNTDVPWIKQCFDDRSIPRWMRDHSNGDMVSPMHCWRIHLEAPPVFVTDPMKMSSPFPADYRLPAFDGYMKSTIDDTTIPQTPRIIVNINEQLSWSFVAQDPNPEDTVTILLLDDPGLPPQMSAGETLCIPRQGEQDMFAAADQGWKSLPTRMVGKSSPCSKAKLQLDWKVPESVAGRTFKVCAVARDDSSSCAGIADPERATSRGWIGEIQCVEFVVSRPTVRFDLKDQPQEINSYVGCTTQIELIAVDCSQRLQPCVGQYRVKIQATTDLPEGAYLKEAEVGAGRTRQLFSWIPQRGNEGYEMQVCFTATDERMTQAPIAPVCFNMTVQKCQYCLGQKDTLSLMMKDYGLDTNWLRLWLHNGNSAPSENKPRISNPDLLVSAHEVTSLGERMGNDLGQPIVWAGLVYKPNFGENLATVAARFRTTIAGLLAVNPDIHGDDDVPAKVDTICVVPCGQTYSDGTRAAL